MKLISAERAWPGMALFSLACLCATSALADESSVPPSPDPLDWQMPNRQWQPSFKDEQPIQFVTTQNLALWQKLTRFWNAATEKAVDPASGATVERNVVRLKLPLGITQPPRVPLENPMTVARWTLGKRLYFDTVLSSDGTVACATCHNPKQGYTDQSPVSTGIKGLKGGMSAPTVLNASFNFLQFWDGRAISLEDQAQGPVQNPVEMFDGVGHAWHRAVARVRAKGDYTKKFLEAFGTEPTRDTIAKAIATYERTAFSGNAIHDRADRAMRLRVAEEESVKFVIEARDYEKVLREAFAAGDRSAWTALGLDPARDAGKVPELAKRINHGRELFFGKARCSNCHVGENFTDNQFHNLGVGVKDGKLPAGALGRFGSQPLGHRDPDLVGAFKTPTLRSLATTGPYMHDGSEKTLKEVVAFYNRGGNVNEFLDIKLRDLDAEKAYLLSRKNNVPYNGPPVKLFGPDRKPIVPLKLNLTEADESDIVLFMLALQGDDVDPIVADPNHWPAPLTAGR
jgi:cytochrome c peroxidase